jgi:hypothetical protein
MAGTSTFRGISTDYAGGPLAVGAYRVALATSNSLDTSWSVPGVEVFAFEFDASWVYLGGDFASVGGVARDHLARVARTSGAALDTSWHPVPDGIVRRLALDASGLLVAGSFSHLDASERQGIGEVDLVTGAPSAWNPARHPARRQRAGPLGGNGVLGLHVRNHPCAHLVARAPRAIPAALDESFVAFPGYVGAPVQAIEFGPDGGTYIGGSFKGVNGYPISHLARLNADGSLDPTWRPNPDHTVLSIDSNATTLVVRGRLHHVGASNRGRVAKFAMGAGGLTLDPLWAPAVDGTVKRVAIDGADAYIGGAFGAGSFPRIGIAKIPLAGSGAPDPAWSSPFTPGADVWSLAAGAEASSRAGFSRTRRAGQEHLVRLSAADGSRTPSWLGGANNLVTDLGARRPAALRVGTLPAHRRPAAALPRQARRGQRGAGRELDAQPVRKPPPRSRCATVVVYIPNAFVSGIVIGRNHGVHLDNDRQGGRGGPPSPRRSTRAPRGPGRCGWRLLVPLRPPLWDRGHTRNPSAPPRPRAPRASTAAPARHRCARSRWRPPRPPSRSRRRTPPLERRSRSPPR